MPRRSHALTFFASALLLFAASEATAIVGAQRTFVASSGNDANPCSLVLPCRAFAAAIAQTITGGEVIVLDSAGYGPVTITQSVSIIAPPGVYAGISVAAGNGVTVATAGISVTLVGLTINSIGGANGILMTNGASLRVENCTVSGFNLNGTAAINVGTAATVVISDTVVTKSNVGIVLDGGANADISHVKAVGNANLGIALLGSSDATTVAVVSDSIASENGVAGIVVLGHNTISPGGFGFCSSCTRNLSIVNTVASGNLASGMVQGGLGATMSVSNSVASNNSSFGLEQDFGGTLRSAVNNAVANNGSAPTSGTISTGGLIF